MVRSANVSSAENHWTRNSSVGLLEGTGKMGYLAAMEIVAVASAVAQGACWLSGSNLKNESLVGQTIQIKFNHELLFQGMVNMC